MRDWLGLPIAASAEAAPIDQTLVLVHWLMLVLFVGWTAFFVYVLTRFRRGTSDRATGENVRTGWALGLEVAVLAVEVALLVVLAIPYWNARASARPVTPDTTVVRVVAEQFAWNVHYPGDDAMFGATRLDLIGPDNPLGLDRASAGAADDVTTVNELHLPVGALVVVQLTSKDVVHSFTLPQMRVKQDTIPGAMQTVWFTPTLVGNWEIVCSQLCGLGHYRMRGLYTIEAPAAFRAWLTAQRPRLP